PRSSVMKLKLMSSLLLLWAAQAYSFPLPLSTLAPYDCPHCETLSHDDLNFSWVIENKPFNGEILHQQISRKFQIQTTTEALSQGVVFYTQAKGAVIRLTS